MYTNIPKQTRFRFSPVHVALAQRLTPGTIAQAEHSAGMRFADPLVIGMDALYQYALWYQKEYDSQLVNDGVLGDYWLDSIKNLRGLLNGDGKKDNGTLENLFWAALEVAGFSKNDI